MGSDILKMVNTYFSQAEKVHFFRFCVAILWSQFSRGGIHSEKLHPWNQRTQLLAASASSQTEKKS
jgi:hypothetical protein